MRATPYVQEEANCNFANLSNRSDLRLAARRRYLEGIHIHSIDGYSILFHPMLESNRTCHDYTTGQLPDVDIRPGI